ncbi:GNAT family N-acetyltransferase [Priestia koreensis]|uniref:GNAT family N-acetyltransferase n=1 Tax=Priestia koreensis TaxID=284581 RepID=UPI001F5923BC|nr:GNAT family N-acetyltransferase [Priestia koreensis]UNL83152.1 GNAT family N-acetyltransferase [Priestia koreensis]
MNLSLNPLRVSDADNLFAFELSNRAYFEKMIPGRGDHYYYFKNFWESLQELLEEQRQGKSYFYLIKNEQEHILGRINLTDLHDGSAHLGYRIGEAHTGKGVASRSVGMLLQEALRNSEVQEIKAKTTHTNIGSQKVLEKNSFRYVGEDDTLHLHGDDVRFVYYEWTTR